MAKAAHRKTTKKGSGRAKKVAAKKKGSPKNSLVANINRRKKAGKSRSKKKSTISKEAYDEMEAGWPDSKKKRAKKSS